MIIRLADKEVIESVETAVRVSKLIFSWSNDLGCEITGIKLSWDAKRVIVSCNPDVSHLRALASPRAHWQEIQMWQIEPSLKQIRSFKGHIQSRFLIRSCFGSIRDRFVLSGSEGEQNIADGGCLLTDR